MICNVSQFQGDYLLVHMTHYWSNMEPSLLDMLWLHFPSSHLVLQKTSTVMKSLKSLKYDRIISLSLFLCRLQDYVRHSSLVINLAKAIGRVVAAHKQIQSFIGTPDHIIIYHYYHHHYNLVLLFPSS